MLIGGYIMFIYLDVKFGVSNCSFSLKYGARKCFRNLMLVLPAVVLFLAGFADVASAMAPPPGGAGGEQGIGGMIQSFLPLILIFVIFYFLLIRPQSKKAKEHKQLLENLKKGDKVTTNGGIHGIIEDMDGDSLTLKVGVGGSDAKIRVNRGYIAGLRTKE
jgi:preprotein translocase subunit YajC